MNRTSQGTTRLDSHRLLAQIASTIELPQLLDLLGSTIDQTLPVDGYAVNLVDSSRESLVCERICLPPALRGMEGPYLRYRLPMELTDINIRVFLKNQMAVVDAESAKKFPGSTESRFRLWNLTSLAALPIAHAGETIGTLMLLSQTDPLDTDCLEQMQQLLQLFAGQMRNALCFTRLRDQAEQLKSLQRDHEHFLHFVTQVTNLEGEETVCEMISREFLKRFSFDVAVILMREEEQLAIRKISIRHDRHAHLLAPLNAFAERITYQLDVADGATPSSFLRNRHFLFQDTQEIAHLPMSEKDRAGLAALETPRTFLCMPIRHNSEPIGILWLCSVDGMICLSDTQMRTIELLSSFIGTAIVNAQLYSSVSSQNKQLRKLATKDRLTGLYNFGHFQEELQRRIMEYRRPTGGHLSIVMIDIDHFKRFNDTHGHVAGNAVLVEIAARMQRLARQMDMVCRYGGEEFIVILPKCNIDGARIFAERARRAAGSTPIRCAQEAVDITISVGCAEYCLNETAGRFIERADKALYQAKAEGRNRVAVACDTVSEPKPNMAA